MTDNKRGYIYYMEEKDELVPTLISVRPLSPEAMGYPGAKIANIDYSIAMKFLSGKDSITQYRLVRDGDTNDVGLEYIKPIQTVSPVHRPILIKIGHQDNPDIWVDYRDGVVYMKLARGCKLPKEDTVVVFVTAHEDLNRLLVQITGTVREVQQGVNMPVPGKPERITAWTKIQNQSYSLVQE